MFADTATISVKAGDGGNGIVSFRTEKYEDRGGPDGGDGGRGGNVIFEARHNEHTLSRFRHLGQITADKGQNGDSQRRTGAGADDEIIPVPVGTIATDEDGNSFDFTEPGQRTIVAHGGEGGFGNAHFKSSRRRTPRVAELGIPGESKQLTLELKLVADVGLVGLPNAGKSTFLSVVSNAKPKIADYPFTTLKPQLGVVVRDDAELVIADIPGLIEGASEGKGLGDEFLRHVERTNVLLQLIDINDEQPLESYQTIVDELHKWRQLTDKPRVVCVTKIDTVSEERVTEVVSQLETAVDGEVFTMSSQAHQHVDAVLYELAEVSRKAREKAAVAAAEEANDVESEPKVYELSQGQKGGAWHVEKRGDQYYIRGKKIERFALKTDPTSDAGTRRLFDIIEKMRISFELQRQGYTIGDTVVIAGKQFRR